MRGARQYGFLVGISAGVFSALHSPAVWALFCAAEAILLSVYAVVIWRRTGMFWMTLGGIIAATMEVVMAAAAVSGDPARGVPLPPLTFFIGGAAALTLTHLAASRRESDGYQRWQRHMESMSLRDLLLLRHIPTLR